MNWYLDVLKKYAVFNGRARRNEYWMFFLINMVISIVLVGVDSLIGMSLFSGIYTLAVLVPSIAVGIRRLHDTNRSGWWMLIALVPFVGIVLLVFMCMDSTPGDNQYGPNPKGVSA